MRPTRITDLTQIRLTSSNVVKNIKSPYNNLNHLKCNHSQQYVITDTLMSRSEAFIHVWFSVSHRAPYWSFSTKHQSPKEIVEEVPNHKFDDQLPCFELMTSLNSDEDVVKVMGADVPLVVQVQAFPELAGLYQMQSRARQEKKDWENMLTRSKMREREYEVENVRNDLIILNRYYPRGGIVAAHPSRVVYSQHDPHRHHPIGTATWQYSPRSPIKPLASGSDIKINPQWDDVEEMEDDLDIAVESASEIC